MASFRGLKAAPVGLTKTVASLRDAVRAQSRSNGKGTRSVATMMPIGVPRVPYKTPNENSWQWVDIWNCLYRERIVWIGQTIDEELGNQLVATMLYLDSVDKSGKDIYLYINTEGGEIVPTMAVFPMMGDVFFLNDIYDLSMCSRDLFAAILGLGSYLRLLNHV